MNNEKKKNLTIVKKNNAFFYYFIKVKSKQVKLVCIMFPNRIQLQSFFYSGFLFCLNAINNETF